MIGRGMFGSPWFFADAPAPELQERLRIAVEHTKLYEKLLGDLKSFAIMKKHFKAYVEGFAGAKELRAELMEAKDAAEVEKIIEAFISASA
jgi:tRNA-dihydrouridine synthase